MAGGDLAERGNRITAWLESFSQAFRALKGSPWGTASFYLLWLVLAELLMVVPGAGMAMHGLMLVALLLHSALVYRRLQHRFLLCLALVPLTRVLSLALPLASFPFVFWYVLVGTPLLIATYLTARVSGLTRSMFGLLLPWRAIPFQLLIGSTGLFLGYVEYLILRPDPLIEAFRWELILLPAIILLVFTGFLEELIFRGAIQYTATQNLGRIGLVYVAVLFTVLHLGYRSVLEAAFVFGVAILFGLFTLRRGSLLGVSLSHGLINISLYLVFPFLLAQPTQPVTPQAAPVGFLAPVVSPPQTPPKTIPLYMVRVPVVMQRYEVEPVMLVPTPAAMGGGSQSGTATDQASDSQPTAAQPTAAPSPQACGPPAGWVTYTVRSGDTLGRLSRAYGISVEQLRQANCLPGSNLIVAGQQLYVPFVLVEPTPQPLPTEALPPTPTEALLPTEPLLPTPTQTSPLPTETPVTPTPTSEPPTDTPVPASDTPEPATDTPAPEPTESRETPTVAPTEIGG